MAIRRATANAQRLGLRNIGFVVGDAEGQPASDRYGLVTMFDAFHHLERFSEAGQPCCTARIDVG